MALYAQFHEARRVLATLDLAQTCAPIECYNNKEQLTKWLTSMTQKGAYVLGTGIATHSFELAVSSPLSYLASEVRKSFVIATDRVIVPLVQRPGASTPDIFTWEYINVYGAHNYDFAMVHEIDKESLLAYGSDVPEDFLANFPCKLVIPGTIHRDCLMLVTKNALSGGVALYCKGKGILQVHVGVAISNKLHVCIIQNERTPSHLDQMMVVNQMMEKNC